MVVAGKVWAHRERAINFFPTVADCHAAIRAVVANLVARSYAERVEQGGDVCDVLNGDENWYLKFYVDEQVPGEELTTISLHPLERPLRTNGGVHKPKGWTGPKPRR